MPWVVEFTRRSEKQLDRLDPQLAERIVRHMTERVAAGDPFAHAERLEAGQEGGWRFRAGDYRLVADIFQDRLLVVVVKVANRSKVYKRR